MLSGATPSAWAMLGTAVFRIVVSSACMKNATATSHGNSRRGSVPVAGCSSTTSFIQSSIGGDPAACRSPLSSARQRLRPIRSCAQHAHAEGAVLCRRNNMCDHDSIDDILEYELRNPGMSRRRFGALTLGAGLISLLPPVAGALTVKESEVDIKTPDGTADAYFVHPATGTAPAVLVWPDIFGLRPAFRQMGRRLAESGYSVLVVNPFYRQQKAPTAPQGAATPIQELMPLARGLNETTHMTDAKAFIGWLDQQPSVAKNRKIGTQGYCMGGPIAFRTSAAVPD